MSVKTVAAAVALLALGMGCALADSPYQPGPSDIGCDVESLAVSTDYPHQSKGTPTDIVGKVRISCTGSVDKLVVIAKLQRLDGGNWVDITGEFDAEYPSPITPGHKYTGQAEFKCPSDGTTHMYRTAGRGYGVFAGRTAKSATWTYSKGVAVTCQTV